jgi:hypothetical protein
MQGRRPRGSGQTTKKENDDHGRRRRRVPTEAIELERWDMEARVEDDGADEDGRAMGNEDGTKKKVNAGRGGRQWRDWRMSGEDGSGKSAVGRQG